MGVAPPPAPTLFQKGSVQARYVNACPSVSPAQVRRRQRKPERPRPAIRLSLRIDRSEERSSQAAGNRKITSAVNAPAGLTSYICYVSCKRVYASTACRGRRPRPSRINTITTAARIRVSNIAHVGRHVDSKGVHREKEGFRCLSFAIRRRRVSISASRRGRRSVDRPPNE